jgi:hypothetical protein
MNCEFQQTGETHKNGKPIWQCVRCPQRLVSETGIARSTCGDRESVPSAVPLRHTAETLPCIHRGEPTGDKVSCGCGARGVKLDVYRCAQFAICTVVSPAKAVRIGRTKPAVCLGCEVRS